MSQVETTPNSRADGPRLECRSRVVLASPTKARCLIENVDPSKSVQCCHLIPRKFTQYDSKMTSLEWYWGMRRNSLNLDTRYNVFMCGSTLHNMQDAGRWALLPSEEIIQQYFNALEVIGLQRYAVRGSLPDIPNDIFVYRLLPLQDMRKIHITYETPRPDPVPEEEEAVAHDDETDTEESAPVFDLSVHFYPFKSMPNLMSHIHPKFAIFALGRTLAALPPDVKISLVKKTKVLTQVLELHRAWLEPLPATAETDQEFNKSPPDDDDDFNSGSDRDDPKDGNYSDDASDHTKPRRLAFKRKAMSSPSPSPASRQSRPPRTAGITLRTIRSNLPALDPSTRVKEWVDKIQSTPSLRSRYPAISLCLPDASLSHSSGTSVLQSPQSPQACKRPSALKLPVQAGAETAEALLGPCTLRGHKRRITQITLPMKKLRI
ncbi:hypothetical protein HGRIS_004278 [Hohenbuehelia grisea]|uniref:HNH nuclease domain-containing protein n=1 Tax=Hohenbuehelia grisea TaxID=104357 RepID=A0ABR3IPA2_9AGAR